MSRVSFSLASRNFADPSSRFDLQLIKLAESTTLCRHISVCRFFGEKINEADPAMLTAYCSGMCDVGSFDLSFVSSLFSSDQVFVLLLLLGLQVTRSSQEVEGSSFVRGIRCVSTSSTRTSHLSLRQRTRLGSPSSSQRWLRPRPPRSRTSLRSSLPRRSSTRRPSSSGCSEIGRQALHHRSRHGRGR